MGTIRAFIAVEIDDQTKEKISELITWLKKSNADAKWITHDQMHLTLKFLGNIDEDKIRDISGALSLISGNFKSFTISLSKIGAFPNLNRPRVIWLGIDRGADSLKSLADKIENDLEKLGFTRQIREFQPHLTLARIRSAKNIRGLVKLAGQTAFTPGKDIKINKLILFQSDLNPKGSIHTVILEKNLTG